MTNQAAIGYFILAATKLKMPSKEQQDLEYMMQRMMDEKKEEEAIKAYKSI